MNDGQHLSARERQVMDALYALGRPASATDVRDAIPDAPTRTAVRTFLRILEAKGHVSHSKAGREFVYTPTRPRHQAARSALRRTLSTFFAGSLRQAVAAYLADPSAKLSEGELSELHQLIAEARKKGR
jgi:BlaI family penicillinase repressor